MAWTTPRDWTNGEVVTETMMDTHVKDNLNYLKGATGAISLDGDLTVNDAASALLALNHTSGTFKSYHGISSVGAAAWNINRNPDSGTFDDTGKSHASTTMDGSGTSSFIAWRTAAAANTFGTERMRLDGNGNLGVGATAPAGRLETRGASVGGMMHYANNGIGGSTITLVADGAGDVASGIQVAFNTKRTGSTVVQSAGLLTVATPGAGNTDTTMFSDGGSNALVLRLNTNGTLSIVRTVGSSTYDVSVWVLWL